MAFRERHDLVVGEHSIYRVTPNPDVDPDEGYNGGIILEWKDPGQKDWNGYFYIESECVEHLGEIFTEIAQKMKEDKK